MYLYLRGGPGMPAIGNDTVVFAILDLTCFKPSAVAVQNLDAVAGRQQVAHVIGSHGALISSSRVYRKVGQVK